MSNIEDQVLDNHHWYHEENGKRIGPISQREIIALLLSAKLRRNSVVWREGFQQWMKVEETELRKYVDTSEPPPLRGEYVRNGIVWTLAFAPILGYVLEWVFATLVYSDQGDAIAAVLTGKLFYIPILFNLALATWDEKRLKNAGYDTSRFGASWLVPTYLYRRAKHTGQSKAYFYVWLVCFFLPFVI